MQRDRANLFRMTDVGLEKNVIVKRVRKETCKTAATIMKIALINVLTLESLKTGLQNALQKRRIYKNNL